MTSLGTKLELRDEETIRAYFDELVLLKSPVQLWLPQSDAPPFDTVVARVAGNTFTTATTPPLAQDQTVFISFLMESHRFNALTQVLGTGVFKLPQSIAQGERRERLRAAFSPSDGIECFGVERLLDSFAAGRHLVGTLMDLSLQGCRVMIEELSSMEGDTGALKRGDVFDGFCIRGLPFTPVIQCRAEICHLNRSSGKLTVGLHLGQLRPDDQRNIERILARRFPTTFGQIFPKKKRKTDIGDRLGAPVQKLDAAKVQSVVVPLAPEEKQPTAAPSKSSPVVRIRKAARRILVIGSQDAGSALVAALQEDEFRNVHLATSFLEAKRLAEKSHYDLLLLELKVGGHFGQEILLALQAYGIFMETPLILVADPRDASLEEVAQKLKAIYIHDRRAPYDRLKPVIYRRLVE